MNTFTPLSGSIYAISDMWNIYLVSLKTKISLLKKYTLKHQIIGTTSLNKSHYFITKSTLYKIDNNLNFTEIHSNKKISFLSLSNFQNNIYLGSKDGIYILKKDKLEKISELKKAITLFNDKNKTLYIGTNTSEIFTFQNDKISKLPINFPKQPTCINAITKDKQDNLWIGTTNGVYKLSQKSQSYYSTINGLGSNIITKIFVDNENNIWFGLYGKGLSKYITEKFFNLQSNNGLDFDNITSISQNKKGDIYLVNSMENSVNIINHKSKKITQLKTNLKSSIVFNKIYADRENNLWLLNYNSKIFRIKNNAILPFQADFFSKNYNLVTDIVQDYNGRYWFTTDSDLIFFDGKSFHKSKLPKDISKYSLFKLFVDSENRLWIGTTKNGLILKDKDKFKEFTIKNGLPSNYIIDITEDINHNIWIATNKGFSEFKEENFTNFTTKDGLSNNSCKFIKSINSKIYIGTGNGLNIYNGNFIKSYFKSDGIVSSEINRNAGFIDNDGNLWFGTKGGVTKYNPNEDFENTIPPKIYFTKINNLDKNIPLSKNIVLNSNQNNITIHYSAISFSNPKNVIYEYKLLPGSQNWIRTNNDKIAFNNLAPNKYYFLLRARNADDIWSHKPVELSFLIKQPLLLQNSFILLYIIIFIGIIIFIFYRRNTLQKKEIAKKRLELTLERSLSLKLKIANERLTQLSKMKDDFLSKVSHELRTPLNAIIGLTDYLLESPENNKKTKEDLSIISQSAKRLNLLVSGILDFTKLQNKEIVPHPVPLDLHQQVDLVLEMYKSINKSKNLKLMNNIPPDIDLVCIDETHFYHIITNLISNAIKFTYSGFVKISAQSKENYVHLSIEDTGIGIPENKLNQIFYLFEQIQTNKSAKGTGLGLSITKKFVDLNKGKIWATSKIDVGSTFHLDLPKSGTQRAQKTLNANLTKLSHFETDSTKEVNLKDFDKNAHQKIVFAIDDELSNLQVLEHYFSGTGLIFQSTDSAEDGLNWILNKKIIPDILLLDIMMPRISGFDILKKVRKIFPITSLPIILLTAKNQISDFVNGLELGANDYIVKPYTKTELLQRVKMHLNISQINKSIMRFVPQEFLNYIEKESFSDIELGDNKKSKMAIMFSDIRSFTELSETMTPRESFDFLNSYLKKIGPIIRKHKGFIDNFIGDATLAVFPDNVNKAVLCAIDMQKELESFNIKRKLKGFVPISVGIGIHWSELIIGTIGEEYRMAETVISSGVNLSSRLENLTKFYKSKILVSSDIIEQINDTLHIHYRFLGNINLKGISLKTKIYEILDCYSGHDLEQRIKSIPDFEKGVDDFERENFDSAADFFHKILLDNPSDLTTKTYYEQCLFYQNKNYFN